VKSEGRIKLTRRGTEYQEYSEIDVVEGMKCFEGINPNNRSAEIDPID
jgi:hypothetical protein